MDERDWMTQLRGAAYRRDGAAVLELARNPSRPTGGLQLLGDGLAAALVQRVDGARPVVADCVDGAGSHDGYRDMVLFLDTVDDDDRADRLRIAIRGGGAFRRFKDVLGRWPGELKRWHEFSDERQRGRARAWLADAGYRVTSG